MGAGGKSLWMVSKRIIESGLSLDWISLQIIGHWVRNTDLRVVLQRVRIGSGFSKTD